MSNKQTLKLMPDYGCYPIWRIEPIDEFDNLDPNDLPIPTELKKDLMDWADRYDAILNQDDPRSSGFKSESEELKFREDGKELHRRLQEELGEEVKITFHVS